jgi:RpiB/LacA/LacB family sugar-phosphate isomerase
MIRQLGTHRGKQVVFGFDRSLVPELDEYLRALGKYGIPLPAVNLDDPHFLTSAQRVCERVRGRKEYVGALVCATGMGMSIAANKFRGIYAARCVSDKDARAARALYNANVLCLAAEATIAVNERIIDTFMSTPFEGHRLEELEYIACMELESDPVPATLASDARGRSFDKSA